MEEKVKVIILNGTKIMKDITKLQLIEDIFDVLADNTERSNNYCTHKEFLEKWDFEVDYTNGILSFWKKEENELEEDERTYYTLTIQ